MPVLANRHDPRKLRERAIEEGRSGEEALRKLMRACNPAASRVGRLSTKKSLKRIESEAQWAKTFAAISERNLGLFTSSRAMELDVERTSEVQEGLSPSQLEPPDNRPTVNCDRAYWRKGKAEKGMNPKKGAPSIKSRTTQLAVLEPDGVFPPLPGHGGLNTLRELRRRPCFDRRRHRPRARDKKAASAKRARRGDDLEVVNGVQSSDMSGSEALGRRLLAEVEEENLGEFLHGLRKAQDPEPLAQLGIPPLDRLLNIFQYSVLHNPKHAVPPLSNLGAHPKGAVIDLSGFSCAGKTQLLYYITAVAILPSYIQGIDIGGKAGAVVLLDTDSRFNVLRLKTVMHSYILQRIPTYAEEELDNLTISALDHLHIFQPQSTASVLDIVEKLPAYLFDSKSHRSSGRVLSSLLIDSISTFYWVDRWEAEKAAIESLDPDAAAVREASLPHRYSLLTKALRRVQQTFSCTVIATSWLLSPPTQPKNGRELSGPQSYRHHLPPSWTSFCTLRLILERDAAPVVEPGLPPAQADEQRQARLESLQKGRFSGWVDQGMSEDWNDGIWEALKESNGGGFFRFRVTATGVVVEE
ncbi:MAG: hypothetical protein M1829_002179 [Trizodia sp. TS-e1964]|nr:MAG: hypothetical protein M1829_002179 [Trizodia sp. TS-e1964]